jgi:bacteriorhodopsin
MTPQFWLWLGFAGMAAGAAVILFIAKRRTPAEEADGIIHGIVPIIAACSYFAMAK